MNPVDVLAAAVNAVIQDRWRSIRDRNAIDAAPFETLHVALAYLNRQEKRIVVQENLMHLPCRSDTGPSVSREADEPMSDAALFALLGVGLLIVCSAIACILVYPRAALAVTAATGLLICLYKLLAPLAALLGGILERAASRFLGNLPSSVIPYLICVFAIMTLLLLPAENAASRPFFVIISITVAVIALLSLTAAQVSGFAAAGVQLGWAHVVNREFVESERMVLMAALSASRQSSSAEHGDNRDGDLAASEKTPLPAPPGITEMVLDNGDAETFGAMRQHLTSARSYHRVVLWSIIVAFLTFFGVSVIKFLTPALSLGDYVKAFGSAGIGGTLFWFGTRVLWANRVSQLSLALFESHMNEVQSCLREIPTNITPEERRAIRMDVWYNFRKGLNRIWLSERELLGDVAKSSRKTIPEDEQAGEK